MAETDPIITEFRADTSALKTGTDQAKQSLREYGDEVVRTDQKTFKLYRQSNNLLASVLALRGAFSITERVLEDFGIRNEFLNRTLHSTELALNIVIAALAVARAACFLTSSAFFIQAKAAFLAAIANVSAATLFAGTAFAVAAAIAAWVIISSQNAPHAQFGGIVSPHPGGTLVRVGEAGSPEAIVPLNDRARGLGGIRIDTINLNVSTNNPDEVMEVLARRIQRLKAAGF